MKEYYLKDLTNEVRVLGRHLPAEEGAVCFWSGSGLELNVKAADLYLNIEGDYETYEPWITWSVNGERIGRMALQKGMNRVTLFRGMNPDVVKRVVVLKETQAMSGDRKHLMIIRSVETDGTFEKLPEHRYRLEIVGDSITSAEGSIGAKEEMDWVSMVFSVKNGYAVKLGEKMDAEIRIVSQSGWGVTSSWDNHPECVIPAYYEQVCGLLDGERQIALGAKEPYDFNSWQPDAVLINLGTNDRAAFDQPAYTDPVTGVTTKMRYAPDGSLDPECTGHLEQAVREFLANVRRCNPKSFILWNCGAIGRDICPYLERAVREYSELSGDKNVDFLLLEEITDETTGARSHPSALYHEITSEILTKSLINIL